MIYRQLISLIRLVLNKLSRMSKRIILLVIVVIFYL